LSYLSGHSVVTLATYAEGDLWAAAVFYVNDGFDLFFLSADHTRHARNIAVEPGVAGTIQDDHAEWQTIRGIQLEGNVRLLDGHERKLAQALYQQKYPFLATAPEPVLLALTSVNWYRLTTRRLYFVDNSLGFGHRDELVL